jgi:hypothetical protein
MQEALSAPGGANTPVHLFHEEREDLALTLDAEGATSAVHTRWTGLAARSESEPRRLVFQSDPAPGDAARLARLCRDPVARLPLAPASGPRPPASDGRLEPEQLQEFASRLGSGVSRLCPGASATVRVVAFDQRVQIARPGRPPARDRRRGFRVRAECRLRRRGRAAHAVEELVLTRIEGDPRRAMEEVAARLAERVERRLEAVSIDGGRLPVVLAPGIGGVLVHELVGHALEADVVRSTGSWLAQLEERVANEALTVLDDPRRGRSPWRVDDEGEAVRATSLISRGRVSGLLHDAASARAAGVQPSGHGRCASFREPVRPRMGCTFIAGGTLRPEEVLDGIDGGIYVRRMEAGTTDSHSGRAAFRVTDADLVRNGAIAAPLHPLVLFVDGPGALRSIDRVADDLAFDRCVGSCHRDGQPLAISVGAPTIWIGLAAVEMQ